MTCFRILLTLALLTVGCSRQEQGVFLAFDYKPGEVYTYEMVDDVRYSSTDCSGKQTIITRQQKQRSVIKVLDHNPEEKLYRLMVSFAVVADTIFYPDDFDGKKEKPIRRDHQIEYLLAMRQDGMIVEVRGKDEQTTEYYESAYRSRQPVFPKDRLEPGYKWKHTIYLSIPENEPIPVVIKYLFAGFEKIDGRKCAVIEYHSAFQKKRDLTPTRWNEMGYKKLLAHYTTKSHGKLYFAIEDGIVAQKIATVTINKEFDIIDQEGNPSQFTRQEIDEERMKLVSIETDSTLVSSK